MVSSLSSKGYIYRKAISVLPKSRRRIGKELGRKRRIKRWWK